jgi:hypothetical protein
VSHDESAPLIKQNGKRRRTHLFNNLLQLPLPLDRLIPHLLLFIQLRPQFLQLRIMLQQGFGDSVALLLVGPAGTVGFAENCAAPECFGSARNGDERERFGDELIVAATEKRNCREESVNGRGQGEGERCRRTPSLRKFAPASIARASLRGRTCFGDSPRRRTRSWGRMKMRGQSRLQQLGRRRRTGDAHKRRRVEGEDVRSSCTSQTGQQTSSASAERNAGGKERKERRKRTQPYATTAPSSPSDS